MRPAASPSPPRRGSRPSLPPRRAPSTHPAYARAPRRHLAQPQASPRGLAVALSCVPLGCAGTGPVGQGRRHGDALRRDVLGTASWPALLGQDGVSR